MDFLISDAFAQAGGAPQGVGLNMIVMIGAFFVIMYFMIIRPQSKQAKEHKQLMDSLSKGDEVITGGGLMGRIIGVADQVVQLEIADGCVVRIQKNSVSKLLPKGTLKTL